MGLKLNRFSTFFDLCNNEDRIVNQFFDSFKLTAILLCDQNDRDFMNEVNRNFSQLSKITGEGLLFITFSGVGNSVPFIGNFAHRALGMTEDEICHLQEALSENAALDRMDLSELARQLYVDIKQLPVIVLTNNIKSDQALIIPTNSKEVGFQLSQLAYLANRHDYHGSLDEIDVVKFGPSTEMIRFNTILANLLTDVLSRQQLKMDSSDRDAIRWNNIALESCIWCLREMEKGDKTEQEWENKLMEYIGKRIARLSLPKTNTLCPFQIDEEKMKDSEDDTLIMLNTFNLFSTLLDANGEIQRRGPVYQKRRYDYSGLSVCLGKMFENELSYSIVQQMRQCIGIPMPKCFGKYYQNTGSFIVNTGNNLQVNLNKCRSKQKIWVAPSIGEAKAAYDRLNRDFNGYSIAIQHEYEDLWVSLNIGRNAASHRTPMNKEGFRETYDDFTKFLNNGFFRQLIRIKQQMRGV